MWLEAKIKLNEHYKTVEFLKFSKSFIFYLFLILSLSRSGSGSIPADAMTGLWT